MYTIGKLKRINKDSDRLEDIVYHMEKRCETILDKRPNGILGIDKVLRENLPKTQYVVGDIIAKEDLENKKTTLPIDKGTVEFKKPPVCIVNRYKYFYLDGNDLVYYDEEKNKELIRTKFNFSTDQIASDWGWIYLYRNSERVLRHYKYDGEFMCEYKVPKDRESWIHLDRIYTNVDTSYITTDTQLIKVNARWKRQGSGMDFEEEFVIDFKKNSKSYMTTLSLGANYTDYISLNNEVFVINEREKKIKDKFILPDEIVPSKELAFSLVEFENIWMRDYFISLSNYGTYKYTPSSKTVKRIGGENYWVKKYNDAIIVTNDKIATIFDEELEVKVKIDIGTKRSFPSIAMYPNAQLYMMYDDTHARRYDFEENTSAYKVLNVNK